MSVTDLKKSLNYSVMESLNFRSELSRDEYYDYLAYKKGYEGEKNYIALLEQFERGTILVSDLLLKINKTIVQIDSLLITHDTVYLYEVKNYQGEYYLEEDILTKLSSGQEITNPAIQLNRMTSLFRQLIKRLGYSFKVKSFVVFINGNFTLYHPKPVPDYLLRSTLNNHFSNIKKSTKDLSAQHQTLAKELRSLQEKETYHDELPKYTYHDLKKGLLCFKCHSDVNKLSGRMIICRKCGYKETSIVSVERHVEEYKRLFPTRKIKTSILYEWCGGIPVKYTIRTVLNRMT